MKDGRFFQEAQDLVNNTFSNQFLNENLFNEFMCLNRQMNYIFLSNYIECLKDTMKTVIPTLSYEDMMTKFIPSYRESMKHLPSSYVLFSLMSFNHFYANFFPQFREEKHYKDIVSILTQDELSLPFDYKTAISLHFPQYYKIKKNNPNKPKN